MEEENVQTEVNNEVTENNVNPGEGKKKGGKGVRVAIVSVLVVALIAVGAWAVITFGRTPAQKLTKMLEKSEIVRLSEEMADKAAESKTMTSTLKLDMENLVPIIGVEYDIGEIALKNKALIDNDNLSGKLSMLIDDQEIVNVDYSKTGELYGATVAGLISKYVAVENNNLKELCKKFAPDITEDELAKIPDKIEVTAPTAEEQKEIEEIVTTLEKYITVVENTVNEYTVVEKNVEIELGGQKTKTNRYSISLDNERTFKLIVEFLKLQENDEKLYNLLKKYEVETYDTFEEWQTELKTMREEMEADIANGEFEAGAIVVEIYESKGRAVRISIETKDMEETGKEVIYFDMFKRDNKTTFEGRATADGEYAVDVRFTIDVEKVDSTYSGTTAFLVNYAGMNIDVKLFTFEYVYSKELEADLTKISAENAVVLNTATDEEVNALYTEFSGNAMTFAGDVMQKLPEKLQQLIVNAAMGNGGSIIDEEPVMEEATSIGLEEDTLTESYEYEL